MLALSGHRYLSQVPELKECGVTSMQGLRITKAEASQLIEKLKDRTCLGKWVPTAVSAGE